MSTPDRRTLWHRHCRKGCPSPTHCACIDTCVCGDLRVAHEYDYCRYEGPSWGVSLVEGSTCRGFVVDDLREGE